MILPCISLHQPWAWLMVNGWKDVENRSWLTNYRGPMLVHASLTVDNYADVSAHFERVWGAPLDVSKCPSFDDIEAGGIVGAWRVNGVLAPTLFNPPLADWHFSDQYGWQVDRQVILPFRPMKGQQRIWNVELTKDEELIIRKKVAA